jgi:hypothetical protein
MPDKDALSVASGAEQPVASHPILRHAGAQLGALSQPWAYSRSAGDNRAWLARARSTAVALV